MQQEHGQASQPSPAKTVQKARTPEANHTGKRSNGMLFPRFQQLPPELRLMVWEAAMTPRLVAVKPRAIPKESDLARDRKNREIKLLRGIPTLFAVNKEARHLALRHYTWRFTIDMTIFCGVYWGLDGRHRRARVVMSPNDTLGLFRCKQDYIQGVRISRFDVKVANNKRSPWRIHETTGAPEHGFKKVAILGDAIESNLHIVRALNITLWDLDSILHAEPDELRTARSPHTKHKILLESAKLTARSRELMRNSLLMDRNGHKLDILAFDLAGDAKGAWNWRDLLYLLSQPRLNRYF